MSTKFPGGIISKTAPTPSGPYADSTAPGVWTLEQQAYWQKLGQWPTAGNVNPNAFIENLFSTYLFTGTETARSITNNIDLSTKGGLIWIKGRNAGYDNNIIDTATGSGLRLRTNSNVGQAAAATGVTSFNTDGFSLGTSAEMNGNTVPYASWTFRQQPKFFDVVTYTGTGSNTTIPHNLGSVPGCIMVKRTDTTADWAVYHRSLANTEYLVLNTTAATATGATRWNSTTPTSTVFSIGTDATVNASGGTYVAYVFAHNAGGFGLTGADNVISCGSFAAGTGSVNLGYEPQWIMFKGSTGSGEWIMFDTMRGWPTESPNKLLMAQSSAAEGDTFVNCQPTATGFNYDFSPGCVYIAIRRGPMKVPTDGTKVFDPDTYSGNGTAGRLITTGFPVDMVIGTRRGDTSTKALATRLTAAGLRTNDTSAEEAARSTFASNVGNLLTAFYPNTSGESSVQWAFQRAPGFFDVVCYTGTGAVRTISHNLGVAPELMISKTRGVSNPWQVWTKYFSYLSGTAASNNCTGVLNSTNAFDGYSESSSINALPTASVFSLGTQNVWNGNTNTAVMYLFATCPGVSKVGSYTGTGAAQTINCGFTGGSRFVMIKRADSTGDWYVWDSARGIIPSNDPYLLLNSTAAEVTSTDYVDTTSVGFDITSTAPSAINANGGTFIFLAIA